MTDKQIIDKVNVKECKYYCNGKCERYEEFVEADYANYSVKCICEKENDLGTYDICDYQQLKRKEQECEEWKHQAELGVDTTDRLAKELEEKEQECEKAKQNAQDTYDLWQALIESFNILQGEKIKLEQECEQQKAEFELFKTSNQTTIDQLKAENEDLKKSVLQECPNCGEEYLNYKGAALYFENSDLKQTLAEIKEICKTNVCKHCYSKFKVDDNYCKSRKNCDCYNILQKINEVENEG